MCRHVHACMYLHVHAFTCVWAHMEYVHTCAYMHAHSCVPNYYGTIKDHLEPLGRISSDTHLIKHQNSLQYFLLETTKFFKTFLGVSLYSIPVSSLVWYSHSFWSLKGPFRSSRWLPVPAKSLSPKKSQCDMPGTSLVT